MEARQKRDVYTIVTEKIIEHLEPKPYSFEELVAEMGACFLASRTGMAMDGFAHNAAYIQSWLKRLRDDRRMAVFAAAKAQRAVDHILGENTGGHGN